MNDIEKYVRNDLFSIGDEAYRDFHAALVPDIAKETIIGVRTPLLRKYAKRLIDEKKDLAFLDCLPHYYYDENTLHGFIIAYMKNFDKCLAAVEKFLPYINNWATCDLMKPKVFASNRKELLKAIKRWISSPEQDTYTVRYAIVMLMTHFLSENFSSEINFLVASIDSDDYYIKMAAAWYFASALSKQYPYTIELFETNAIPEWVHNKAISKALDSRCIARPRKEYLKTLRQKHKMKKTDMHTCD